MTAPLIKLALSMLFVLACCPSLPAGLVVLDDVKQGQFISTGSNFSGSDFMVIGESEFWGIPEYRSFLTFDLAGITGTVIEARLELQADNYNETGSLDVSLYDYVLGNDAALNSDLVSIPAFEDLGTGNVYASTTINTAVGEKFSVAVNGAAVSDINLKIGELFTIGFAADSLQGSGNANIRLDRDPSLRVNQLILTTAVPEPGAV